MMRFVNSALCHWFLVLLLSAGFCLGLTVSADAELIPEKKLIEEKFNLDKWKKHGFRSVTVYYGSSSDGGSNDLLSTYFTYKNTQYRITGISSSYPTRKVKIDISPKFPPDGSVRSDFNLHVGSTGHSLTKFNFGDTTNNTWSGSAGFLKGYIENDDTTDNGTLKITVRDSSFTDNLEFSESRPTPVKNSDGKDIEGRLQIVGKNSDGHTVKWRICNRDFGVEEAKVACRQMGLPTSGVEVADLSKTGWLTNNATTPLTALLQAFEIAALYWTPALLDKIQCTGSETKLYQCKHLGLAVLSGGSCPIANTAAVRCADNTKDCICGKSKATGLCLTREECRRIYPTGGY